MITDPPVYPQTYEELRKDYGNLIIKLLLKSNKIEQNFDDLHGYVWMKLLEAQLLARFEEHIQKQHPKTLYALEACSILGVSWIQWSAAMSAFHRGTPYVSKGRVIGFKLGHWMPSPINTMEFETSEVPAYLQQGALYSFKEVIHLGNLDSTFSIVGQEIQEGVVVASSRPEGRLKLPEVKVTKDQFKNYLTMAVLNHYANFCRTKNRRHKERPVTLTPHGEEDASQVWEATLPDIEAADSELQVTLFEACTLLSNTLHDNVSKMDLPNTVEYYEKIVFEQLGAGSSIMQALKKSELPLRAQRAILNVVRPKSVDYR